MSLGVMDNLAAVRRILAGITGAGVIAAIPILTAVAVQAQTPQGEIGEWSIGAATGAYVPSSALIRAADQNDTGLAAGPSFSLEPEYQASRFVAVYGDAGWAFSTIRLGSSIQPAVVGPSNRVTLTVGTVGVLLTSDWLGPWIQPTLRVGGGFKWYAFDLAGASNQVRPTADIGVGFRGAATSAIQATAEVRYLLSSFDQAKLPTRGIATQNQRQNDLLLSIGFRIRLSEGQH